MMGTSWAREHLAWRGQCFPGGALLWEEPWEHPVPPASSSAGSVWEQCIERQLVTLAVQLLFPNDLLNFLHLPPIQLTVPLQATGWQVLTPEADAGEFCGAS